ncbi:MAG: hypothetical protein P8Y53_04405 [Pseudolabrys sp.]
MLRACVVLAGLLVALPAFAGEMTAAQARRFVVGKTFVYHCFEGTRGEGRVYANGSVAGTIQFQGRGRTHYAALPAGTLRVVGGSVCASLRGLPFQPCFNLERTGAGSFRGSISGLGFAYCSFRRHYGHAHVSNGPLALRPSLTADASE